MNNRNRLLWIGLFLQTAGWQLLLPHFTAPSGIGVVLLIAGAAMLGFSANDGLRGLSPGALACYAVAAILNLFLVLIRSASAAF